MAVLVVTAAQVLSGANAETVTKITGVAVTAGQALYLVAATDQWALCDANLSAAGATFVGIALNDAAAGQWVTAQKGGTITLGAGAAPVNGTIYVAAATAGGIAPAADLASGWYVSIIGVGDGTGKITLFPRNTGIVI